MERLLENKSPRHGTNSKGRLNEIPPVGGSGSRHKEYKGGKKLSKVTETFSITPVKGWSRSFIYDASYPSGCVLHGELPEEASRGLANAGSKMAEQKNSWRQGNGLLTDMCNDGWNCPLSPENVRHLFEELDFRLFSYPPPFGRLLDQSHRLIFSTWISPTEK